MRSSLELNPKEQPLSESSLLDADSVMETASSSTRMPYWIPVVGLLILNSYPVWFWWKDGYLLTNGDNFPRYFLLNEPRLDLWIGHNKGYFSVEASKFLYQSLWAGINWITQGHFALSQALIQTLLYFGAGLGFFLLANQLLRNRTIAFAAGVLYSTTFPQIFNLLSYPVEIFRIYLPFIIYLYIGYLRRQNLFNPFLAWSSLVSFVLIGVITISPPYAILVVCGYLITELGVFLYAKRSSSFPLRKRALFLALQFLVCLPFVYPQYLFFVQGLDSPSLGVSTQIQDYMGTFRRSGLANIFWFNTTPGWPQAYPYADFYSGITQILAFVPMFVFIVAVALAPRTFQSKLLPALVLVLGLIFIIKGVNPPLGGVNFWVYEKFPVTLLFRNPLKFLDLLIPVVILLTCWSLTVWETPKNAVSILWLLILAQLVVFFPYITGQVFSKDRLILAKHSYNQQVRLPRYWIKFAEKLRQNTPEKENLLLLPNNVFYATPYIWKLYAVDGMPEATLNQNLLYYKPMYINNQNMFQQLKSIYESIETWRCASFKKKLGELQAQNILLRKDVVGGFRFGDRTIIEPKKIEKFLRDCGYQPTLEEGLLSLYPTHIDVIDKLRLVQPKTGKVLPSDLKKTSSYEYEITFKPESLEGAMELIFNENYHAGWVAELLKKAESTGIIIQKNHAKPEVNSWKILKDPAINLASNDSKGDTATIQVKFKPQSIFHALLLMGICVIALLFGLCQMKPGKKSLTLKDAK